MSQGSSESSDTITAEFRDGQLQIVEVGSYDRAEDDGNEAEVILPDLQQPSSSDSKNYVQVMDASGKGVMHLVNFTLVRCDEGQSGTQFKLVANNATGAGNLEGGSVACVLQSSDGEDQDGQESYVIVDGREDSLMYLESAQEKQQPPEKVEPKKALTPAELIERAKLLQKAKAVTATSKRGRKRKKGDLPPPHELLASPNFRLFLYNCKACSFKCNAIKELSAHRIAEHSGGTSKWRSVAESGGAGGGKFAPKGGSSSAMQCAKCPYRASTYAQFMRHLKDTHSERPIAPQPVTMQVLVCGACGFESSVKAEFKKHVFKEHDGASTILDSDSDS